MSKEDPNAPAPSAVWNLVPLTPEYLAAEHSGYVSALEVALEDDEIRNIALSGNYGVGKSSILRELGKRLDGRVVELSLSTLAPIEASRLDESVPLQATTPTNRIQQEIVKQLLYREDPSKTPASRFRRIERFRWWREFGTAALIGLAVAVIFLLTGWTAQIARTFTALNDLDVWTHLIVWGVATTAVILVRWLFYGKIRIKQLSAGAATVTLDDNSVSYFDQYLDEIVYFFDVSDRDVVIFEDIDRFNDSHIFETLRALNTLLNASPQIEKPIRFIYAIKDSIFDRIGLEAEGRKLETGVLAIDDPAQAEAVRANRTKFFDLVIPVVPFITHRSARNLATQLLGKIEHKVAPELLDLAAQYVPDMRLLKNVRNEFIIFRDRIFSGDGEQLDLSETDLFAMMLYKSTHLTDFETIRLGKSNLDTLYKVSRELVANNIKRIEGERRGFSQRLARKNIAEARSDRLGASLIAHLERTATSAAMLGTRRRNGVSSSVDGAAKSDTDLRSVDFWASFVAADGDPELRQQMSSGHQLTFSRSSLSAVLGDPLDADSWDGADHEALMEQIQERTDAINFLRGADMGDLIKRPEFLVMFKELDTSASEGTPATYKETKQSLEYVAKALLKPGLAYQLVRAGHINRNFTLYTSTFHGDRVSPSATNFIIHHVERDLMDAHFELGPRDVDAVVRERGKSALKEPALYNIAILDRLLVTDVDAADIMIRSLVGLGESQTQFLQAYLTAGEQRAQLVQRFVTMSPRTLIYLVNQAELDEASQLELVDVALANLSSSAQRTDARVVDYLRTHYAEFSVLTNDWTSAQAEQVGALFAEASITLPSLTPLSASARPSFVSRSLYDITHENLTLAIGNDETVALDVIRAANKTVYGYVLQHVDAYLGAVEGSSATVDAGEQFIAVLEELLEQGTPRLADVVERSAPVCQVVDLGAISEGAWPALAMHQRFPATFNNVSRYVAALGFDVHIAPLLAEAGALTEAESAEEDEKTTLATTILAAREQLPAATLRAGLVASLELSSYLDVGEIAAESGDLFALLLKHDIISDDAESYEHLSTTNWPTRRAFIRESEKFASYMTPELVQPDLAVLLADNDIEDAIKRVVVEQSAPYAEVAGQRGLNELARLAVQYRRTIPSVVVQKMAQGGASAQYVVPLLEPHLGDLARADLFAILQALSGEYSSLTTVGRTSLHVANTPADRALLECLKSHGTVSSYDTSVSPIKVNRKHK
ncbi:DNA-binding protein [Micrococcus luteus]|uniref:YobI family P-loop NTPase n=1 Tax=Micrococcus TaxID=1269 RepID=UPI0022B43DAC|nr:MULTISPECIES: DNA-binding protein [Micrococcus]MCZ6937685.1 DNA-binding protein [Micrococcus luteus]WRQ44642.1 DNA-binding protein [Micrococcus sp. HOU1]